MEKHREAVTKITELVRKFYQARQPFRISHGSSTSTRPKKQGNDIVVDINALNNVLQVCCFTNTILVEPNVPMDRLVEATLKHGLIPPVVPEFPGITVGGAFAGGAAESSSFRYGFFESTVKSIEIILGNGDTVSASPTEHADLFRGSASALGSLGTTTLLKLKLTKAKKYVKVSYLRMDSIAQAIQKIRLMTEDVRNDYVDGIMFSDSHTVIIVGELTDEEPESGKIRTFSHAFDPWFYEHVKDITKASADLIPEQLPSRNIFRLQGISSAMTAEDSGAPQESQESKRYIAQDVALPYHNAEAVIKSIAKSHHIWPLWLCPLKPTLIPTLQPHTGTVDRDGNLEQMLNIGLWGFGPADLDSFVGTNRQIEQRLRDFAGRK
ncbi:MAG: hypothetical protein M1820_005132 [Bogoriella megaspora]|nr:MAG: hypothetical protein M1820_005132 [Bogoriella megaspora]